ncbi:13963_t:CDS:2 [Funneliformis geosporum]|uniref:13963_t:CDS:1 n=1 Tax=Funneliformis geosporum TaxID=1117311 RepID=A0A9W4SP08_9GLOM|nr:13963_t:CDS:2 [Funneliformis geosporum]
MVYKKDNKLINLHFIFIIIYLLLIVESFTPVERYGHSSVLVGNKIYFFGGYDGRNYTNEVFYLDLSQKFDTELPPWTDLTSNSGIGFKSSWATTVAINDKNNNPIIFLIGGVNLDQVGGSAFTSLVYTFNLQSGQWKIPKIKGTETVRRSYIQAVVDETGKIYVFGGLFDGSTGLEMSQDMIILNTNDLTLSYGTITNSPLKRYLYTATLLPNGMILYIGGLEYDNIEKEHITL